MRRSLVILIVGTLMIGSAWALALAGPTVSEKEIIRSFASERIDWKVESAMATGTASTVLSVVGFAVIIYGGCSLLACCWRSRD